MKAISLLIAAILLMQIVIAQNTTLIPLDSLINSSNKTLITSTNITFNSPTNKTVSLRAPVFSSNLSNATNQTRLAVSNTTILLSGVQKEKLQTLCSKLFECLPAQNNEYYFDCYFDEKKQECQCFTGARGRCQNKDNRCAVEYECEQTPLKEYFFDCYYDKSADNCKCFTGDYSKCRNWISKREQIIEIPPKNDTSNITIEPTPEVTPEQKSGAIVTISAIIILIVIGVLLGILLSRKSSDNLLSKAQSFHKRGLIAHERGLEDEAEHYYREAAKARKQAMKRK